MRPALLLAVLLFSSPARAGVVYDFVTTIEAPRTSTRVGGRVWADGDSYRAELNPDPARRIDVVISNDADRTAVFLDLDAQTWVERIRVNHDIRSSGMFTWPVRGAEVSGRPRVEHRIEATEDVAGQRATRHVVRARFRVESRIDGSPVRGSIETIARIWIAESLPTLPMNRQIRTGYEKVDRRLEPIFARLSGMIVRHELEVVRTMDGGPPQREITKTVVSDVQIVDVPRDRFDVPPGFTYVGTRYATRE